MPIKDRRTKKEVPHESEHIKFVRHPFRRKLYFSRDCVSSLKKIFILQSQECIRRQIAAADNWKAFPQEPERFGSNTAPSGTLTVVSCESEEYLYRGIADDSPEMKIRFSPSRRNV